MSKADSLRSSLRQTAISDENKEKQHLAHEAILNNELLNKPTNEGTSETSETSNVPTIERTNKPSNVVVKTKVERRRFSFDLRPDLHRDLKMQCLLDDSNMYEVVEMLIENYLHERRNQRS